MKKHFGDKDGDELLSSIIFLVVLVMLSSLLIFFINPEGYGADMPEGTMPEGLDFLGDAMDIGLANLWNPKTGINVTENGTIDNPFEYKYSWQLGDHEAGQIGEFYEDGDNNQTHTNIHIYVVRDNEMYEPGSDNIFRIYDDYILISRAWGYWSYKIVPVSFEKIIDNAINNVSFIDITLNANFTLIIECETNENISFSEQLYNDNYTIYLGIKWIDQLERAQSNAFWNVILGILTLSLPDCHPVINAILATPFYAALGYCAAAFFAKFIP